jgi:hypothetical protein
MVSNEAGWQNKGETNTYILLTSSYAAFSTQFMRQPTSSFLDFF